MATSANLRSRRSEAQLHALAEVQRDIRGADPSNQRKYLRDFSQAFRTYESVLSSPELLASTSAADLVLVGDYHALPACQRFAATLLEQRAQPADRPVVLAIETIFSRDQHILDEWWRREIEEGELRSRIRFDADWGYDWTPFYELLVAAREHAEAIYGLDFMPREDLRKISARDRHAAHKIVEIRQKHPNAVILVLFGESHLAPGHLPYFLRQRLPEQKILTVLQNVDPLYWQAAGEQEPATAVRVAEDVVCVFNSTPLEKYENYRLHLSRWRSWEDEGPDLAPTIYNLIDSLVRFLGIDRYSSHNTTQPKFLVDLLPEVFSNSDLQLRRLLQRETAAEKALDNLQRQLEERGSLYLPRVNAFYVSEFRMMYGAEEAARFLHHACRALPSQPEGSALQDCFHIQAVEHALSYFGSRVLYPARPAQDGRDLLLKSCQNLAESAPACDSEEFEQAARQLGYALGSDLYEGYLAGSVSRSQLRRLFLTHLDQPGRARKVCEELLTVHRLGRKGPYPDHSRAERSRLA